jgi:SAM-dependent methyltransferase
MQSPSEHGLLHERDHCPSCWSTTLERTYAEPYTGTGVSAYLRRHYEGRASDAVRGGLYELARCSSCTLTFQKYVPDEALVDEIYNRWIPSSELDRSMRDWTLDQYRYVAEEVQYLIQHFGRRPNQLHFLDFGFGWAQWSRMAMAYGCRVSGVELSHERAEHGRSIGLEVLALDGLPPGRFDFIHTEQVLEHLTEPRPIVKRLAEALAPGGLIKISVPDAAASLGALRKSREFGALTPAQQMPIAPLEHVNSFSHASLVAFARTLGLAPVRPNFYRLYNSASGLLQPRQLLRVLARPVYRHVYPRSTFQYFRRENAG